MISLQGSTWTRPLLLQGLSTDEKPIDNYGDLEILNADEFLEMDTGEVYFFDGDSKTWIMPD